MDIKIKDTNNSFHYRVRGIIIHNNKFLIMRVDDADYYHIPGGHVEIGETSEEAIIREIKEEVGIDVIVKKTVCICEQFYSKEDKNFHEIVLYYLLKPRNDIELENKTCMEDDKGHMKKNELRWLTLEELKTLDVKPKTIKDMIINKQLNKVCHLIHKA